MQKVLTTNLWAEIQRLASKSKTKKGAIAYVATDKYLKFDKGDTLIVDASDNAIACGQTSALVLRRAYKRGAKIFSSDRLHAKFLILDNVAIIGSANLSASSANELIEVAVVSDNPPLISSLSAIHDQLSRQCRVIDGESIKHLSSIKVVRPQRVSRKSKKVIVESDSNRTWIVGVHELDESRYTREQPAIKRGEAKAQSRKTSRTANLNWIRWPGNSRFRAEAKEGDNLIQIWCSRKSKKPNAVYKRAAIILRQEEPACTRFFLEEPSSAEKEALSWRQFRKLLEQISFPGKVGPTSQRVVEPQLVDAIYSLWNRSH
jgi:hypothetical protein